MNATPTPASTVSAQASSAQAAPFTRRHFLQTLAAGAVGASLPARVYAGAAGSNDAVRLGGIGFNGRGMSNLSGLLSVPGVRVTALCDVDSAVLDKGRKQMEDKGQTVQVYSDLRRLLESKEVDAVMIATPNHWHTLAAIWAMQAGKDVYVEKPVTHTLWEGKQLVAAAAQTGRIAQSGTQSRSSAGLQEARIWLQEGHLGKLLWAHGTCYKRRPSIGKVSGARPVPATVDYDLWCGPSAKGELLRAKLHYDWHWFWETGNGDFGNQGVHQVDIARWFMGENGLPPSAISLLGGRFGYEDDGQTPNSQLVSFQYEKAPLYFEVRGLPAGTGLKEMDNFMGSGIGVVLQYEKGHVLIPSYTAVIAFDAQGGIVKRWGKYTLQGETPEPKPTAPAPALQPDSHHANFIRAVRSRKAAELNCNLREGELSSALCHLAGISHRLGAPLTPEAIREQVKADAHAVEALGRMGEHLKRNDALPEKAVFGVPLKVDVTKEVIVGNPAATELARRKDRAPFTVPELV